MRDAHGNLVGPAMALPPRGFREDASGAITCPHRDMTCCPACAAAHPQILDVLGAHFWVASETERAALVAEIARAS